MSRPTEDWMQRMPLSPLENGTRRGKLRAVKSLDMAAFNSRRPVSKAQTMPALRTVKSMAFEESSDSESDECLSLSPPLDHSNQDHTQFASALEGLGVAPPTADPEPVSSPPKRTHRRALSRITHIGKVPPLEKPDSERTPLNSPKVDQLCIFTAADMVETGYDDEGIGSLQDILSILAQKERRVLEAKDALRQARGELKVFRDHLKQIMDPYSVPLGVCITPRIISRNLTPNLGVNGLHLIQQLPTEIDREIFQESMAFRLVHSLLGLVHCIISIFPRQRSHTEWSREYLSPTGLLYGMGE